MTMQTETTQTSGIPERRDLGNGLVLRWSTAEDTEGLEQLTSMVFRDSPQEPPNQPLADLLHHLLSDTHPLMGSVDYALVEDMRKQGNRIVACTCLWRQTWEYEGIPFRIGRPEIVATDPEYRNRGLIREIFGLVHARSAAEGHLVQAITGIPYYYRQFGYEYALDLDNRDVDPVIQVERVFIAELAVVVGDTCDGLHEMALRRAARMYQPENFANQPAIAIFRVGGHDFGTANSEGDALVFPRLPPQAGTGHDAVALLAHILDQRVIDRPHQRVRIAEQVMKQVGKRLVRRLLRAVAEDHARQLLQPFGVLSGRPAQDEAVAEVAPFRDAARLCCFSLHCHSSSISYSHTHTMEDSLWQGIGLLRFAGRRGPIMRTKKG